TDADGRWSIGGIRAPAFYEVTFLKDGFTTRSQLLSVAKKDGNVALDITLVPAAGTVSGSVLGPDGPLGDVVVSLTNGSRTVTTTSAGGSRLGTWVASGLDTPGTWLVTFEREGFGTERQIVEL